LRKAGVAVGQAEVEAAVDLENLGDLLGHPLRARHQRFLLLGRRGIQKREHHHVPQSRLDGRVQPPRRLGGRLITDAAGRLARAGQALLQRPLLGCRRGRSGAFAHVKKLFRVENADENFLVTGGKPAGIHSYVPWNWTKDQSNLDKARHGQPLP